MPIKEINNNGKSKIISSKTGVLASPHNGHTGNKAGSSAPSHNTRPMVNLGHANSTVGDNEGKAHESKESKSFEKGEDMSTSKSTKKVVSDRGRGGRGMKGSY